MWGTKNPSNSKKSWADFPVSIQLPRKQDLNRKLFKELVDETTWKTALKDKEAEQIWQLFKDIFLRAKER